MINAGNLSAHSDCLDFCVPIKNIAFERISKLRFFCRKSNPYHSAHVEWLDAPPQSEMEIFEEPAKSILSENDSPDLGFRFSVNPYRGCQVGCGYCFARPTHEFLGFSAGLASGLQSRYAGSHYMALEFVPGVLTGGGAVQYPDAFTVVE